MSKQFKAAVRSANLNNDIHFHNLRHSFVSNLVQRGVNLYVVKELLGHENIKTTQLYII
ncbi:MAG: tyrosine-type recombinase/integrase [Ignavibacteriales bacterium]|nr:tyrosine-type recombinase/integrase [Ignavibacteriales bacterium]MBP9120719.1 tyrosine-type recombinase/integrase [Ignavibacterium sp.]